MKTVLITGSSRGIGKALALKFINEGWFVIGTCVSGLNLLDSKSFKGYDLDLSSSQSIELFSTSLIQSDIKLDMLINNAGIVADEFEEVVVIKKLRETLEVNLFGLIDLTEQLLPLMKENSQIFNISSTAGMLGKELDVFKYPSYKISKTALNMYTRTLAGRLVGENIFVASVHPGWVKTDMGGMGADLTPEESADFIYNFAMENKSISDTGLFWFKGEKIQW